MIPTVFETFELPGGPPDDRDWQKIRIRARLVAGSRGDEVGYATASNVVVGHEYIVDVAGPPTTDGDPDQGTWELALRYNIPAVSDPSGDAIDIPTDTRWEITPIYPGGVEGHSRYIQIDESDGDGPFEVHALEVGAPEELPATAYAQLVDLEATVEDLQGTAGGKVAKAGDTMSGALAMGGHKVTGLDAADSPGDAVRWEQMLGTLVGHTPDSAVTAATTQQAAVTELVNLARHGVLWNRGKLVAWHAAVADGDPKVTWIGDSLAAGASATGFVGFPHLVTKALHGLFATRAAPTGYLDIEQGAPGTRHADVNEGTPTVCGASGYGTSLAVGESVEHTDDCDQVGFRYTSKASAAASIAVYIDDVLVDTVSTTATAKGGRKWTSSALSFGSHKLTLTATVSGTAEVDSLYFYAGDGPEVIVGAHAGATTANFTSGGIYDAVLDDLELNPPDLVIIATGTNDATAATYGTSLGTLIDNVRAVAATASILVVIPPELIEGAAGGDDYRVAGLAVAYSKGAAVVDCIDAMANDAVLGASTDPLSLVTVDGVHWTDRGHQVCADAVLAPLVGSYVPAVPRVRTDGTTPITGQQMFEVPDRSWYAVVLDSDANGQGFAFFLDRDTDTVWPAAVFTGGNGTSVPAGIYTGPGGDFAAGAYDAVLARTAAGVFTLTGRILAASAPTTGSHLANKTYVDGRTPAASTSTAGLAELAEASEVSAGTSAALAVTPDALAGSTYGVDAVQVTLFAPGTLAVTGDGAAYMVVPAKLNGFNLLRANTALVTAGTGATTVQVHNLTQAADMLTTRPSIDSGETTSYTGTAGVPDGSNDDVATGDVLRFDVDAVGTGAKGLMALLEFQAP